MSFLLNAAAAAAATTLALPQPSDDVLQRPHRAFVGDGVSVLELAVDEGGVVRGCAAVLSNFADRQNERACELLMERSFAAPARGADGGVRPGVYSLVLTRSRSGGEPNLDRLPPHMEVLVESLPESFGGLLSVQLAAEVNADGRILECGAAQDEDQAAYVQVACEQLGRTMLPERPQALPAGQSYVRPFTVRFLSGNSSGR